MNQLLQIILLTTIWILGIKIATQNGMVFGNIGEWAQVKLSEGNHIWEPLILCEWCMPTIHGIFGVLAAYALGIINVFDWHIFVMYPFIICGASFLTGTLWQLCQYIMKAVEVIDHKEQLAHLDLKDRKTKFYYSQQNGNENGHKNGIHAKKTINRH